MSNYTKTTDFAAKDTLPSGDSGKIIRGSEFETEFDNIATAVNSKSDTASPTFTGTVTTDNLTATGVVDFSGASSVLGGVPAGGTTGQVLSKASNTDYDVTFVDPVSTAEDVTFTPAGSITATDVQAAIEELDSTVNTSTSQQFTGDGSTTGFTLSASITTSAAITIFIDGIYQEDDTYTVVGTALTFTEAPPSNASIEVLVQRVADIGTADANNVTYTPAGTGAVQTTVQTKLRESVSVKDFGAVGDGVTDDTAAIQAALNAGDLVFFPNGTYKITSVKLNYNQHVFGEGFDTKILPTAGSNTFVLSSDNITIEDLFFNDTSLSYAEDTPTLTANCIYTDAVTYNAGFVRGIQAIKISRCQFVNIKGAAIYINQSMRESYITECRFFGMGNSSTGVGAIHGQEALGSGTNINNIFITNNIFYRFDVPPINLKASTILANTVPSYADIHIESNLIHNQKLETSGNVQPVEAEETDMVFIQRIDGLHVSSNFFTSLHPDHVALNVGNHANYENRFISITNNRFSIDVGRSDLTYPGVGKGIAISELRVLNIIGNTFRSNSADRYAADIDIDRTTASPINAAVLGNTIVNGTAIYNWPSAGYTGLVQDVAIFNVDKLNTMESGTGALPAITIGDDVNTGFYSAASDVLGISVGGTARLLAYTNSLRPNPTNAYQLGTASARYSAVYSDKFHAGTGSAVVFWTSGAGTPEGSVSASVGSLYTRTDGGASTTLYVKESGTGNTGWVAK
jgi:hypothetical protein